MHYVRHLIATALGTAVLFSGTSVHALPLFDFTSGSEEMPTPFSQTLGYSFKVTGEITVDGIGLFDSDGLDSAHEVALWKEMAVGPPLLLVEVLFPAHSTGDRSDPSKSSQGNYIYMDIDLDPLGTGVYVVGASYITGQGNKDEVINTVTNLLENAGNVGYITGRFMFGNGINVEFPMFTDPDNDYFGPALRIQATIPEPQSVALLVLGILGIVGMGCNRRQLSRLSNSITA
jgi:hypothetical protein